MKTFYEEIPVISGALPDREKDIIYLTVDVPVIMPDGSYRTGYCVIDSNLWYEDEGVKMNPQPVSWLRKSHSPQPIDSGEGLSAEKLREQYEKESGFSCIDSNSVPYQLWLEKKIAEYNQSLPPQNNTIEDLEAVAENIITENMVEFDIYTNKTTISKNDLLSLIIAGAKAMQLMSGSKVGGEEVDYQWRVYNWMLECFGDVISRDRVERNHRFLEEALELVQSLGCTKSEAMQLVDYVFGREVGEPTQEVGGVVVTLAALCLANDFDMMECGETELARIWTKIDKIREKQAAKPKHSPLPSIPAVSIGGGENAK